MTASSRGGFAAATDDRTEHVGWGSHFRRMHTEEVHDMEAQAPFRPVLLSQPGSRSAPVMPPLLLMSSGMHVFRCIIGRAPQLSACKWTALRRTAGNACMTSCQATRVWP